MCIRDSTCTLNWVFITYNCNDSYSFFVMFQHHIYNSAVKVPEELKEILPEETYDKARLYGLDKSSFSMFKELYNILITTVSK